jgi:hypothetical protein
MNQQMHIYKCVQLGKIILQQHTSVTLVTNVRVSYNRNVINPSKAELHSVCHLLALLGAYLIFHVSRIRVNIQIIV